VLREFDPAMRTTRWAMVAIAVLLVVVVVAVAVPGYC
jgi:hypothetical protein